MDWTWRDDAGVGMPMPAEGGEALPPGRESVSGSLLITTLLQVPPALGPSPHSPPTSMRVPPDLEVAMAVPVRHGLVASDDLSPVKAEDAEARLTCPCGETSYEEPSRRAREWVDGSPLDQPPPCRNCGYSYKDK